MEKLIQKVLDLRDQLVAGIIPAGFSVTRTDGREEQTDRKSFRQPFIIEAEGPDGEMLTVTGTSYGRLHEELHTDPYGIERWWENDGETVRNIVYETENGKSIPFPTNAKQEKAILRTLS